MAKIMPVGNNKYGYPLGWRILGVPMPDGEKRDYAAYGRNAIAQIIRQIRADKKAFLSRIINVEVEV